MVSASIQQGKRASRKECAPGRVHVVEAVADGSGFLNDSLFPASDKRGVPAWCLQMAGRTWSYRL